MNKLKNENLETFVEKIILKYCPKVDDRLYILDNARITPQIDINFDLNDNKTNISFIIGTSSYKSQISEELKIEYYIGFIEMKRIINFILEDHEIIKDIRVNNNEIELEFAINWNDNSIKGISCGDIKIKMNFQDNIGLKNKYIYFIFENYINYLKKTPFFIKNKNDYLNKYKKSYINSLSKMEILNLMSYMEEEKLREILFGIDNDLLSEMINKSKDDREKMMVKTI